MFPAPIYDHRPGRADDDDDVIRISAKPAICSLCSQASVTGEALASSLCRCDYCPVSACLLCETKCHGKSFTFIFAEFASAPSMSAAYMASKTQYERGSMWPGLVHSVPERLDSHNFVDLFTC